MVWLPGGEKKIDDMFICFVRMYERDGQTNKLTPHDGYGRAA